MVTEPLMVEEVSAERDDITVDIIQREDLLGTKESLYRKIPRMAHEIRDLSYFDFVAQNESRKSIIGVFGTQGTGKTSFIKYLARDSIIKGTGDRFAAESMYEAEREMTVHNRQGVVFVSGASGMSRIMTLIDTPGHMDFISDAIEVVRKIDVAVMVADVRDDLYLYHDLVLKRIKASRKPVVVVINKADTLMESESSRVMLLQRISHIRHTFEDIIDVESFYIASMKYSRVIRANTVLRPEDLEECIGIDVLVDGLALKNIFEYVQLADTVSYNPLALTQHTCDEVFGFVKYGDILLCNLLTSRMIGAGSCISIHGRDLTVKEIYIQFVGCMVRVENVAPRIGAIVRLHEDLDDLIHREGGTDASCVRVIVKPDIQDEFDRSVSRLSLLYSHLAIDRNTISGCGELYLDVILHDLKKRSGVGFEVLAVFPHLKETFVSDFEERLEIGDKEIVISGGRDGESGASALEKSLMRTGPLFGEPIWNSYLRVSGTTDVRLQARISDVLVRHTSILEPVYMVEVKYMPEAEEVVDELICTVGNVINRRTLAHSTMKIIVAHIPVALCFGLETDLRVYSCSLADCCKVFSHWSLVDCDRTAEMVGFMRRVRR